MNQRLCSLIWYPEVKEIIIIITETTNKQKINSIYKVHWAKIMGNLNSSIWTIPQCSAKVLESYQEQKRWEAPPLSQPLQLLQRFPLPKLSPCCSFIFMTCFVVYNQLFISPCNTILPRGKVVQRFYYFLRTEQEKKNLQKKMNKYLKNYSIHH